MGAWSEETWSEPQWLCEAHPWIDAQLERSGTAASGPCEQIHLRPWSTGIRVPNHDGDLYFKANTPALRHEAALLVALAERRPDCVPSLLAVDVERGWMLMADAGTRLSELVAVDRDLSRWLEILPLYAGLQLDVADLADELVAVGVPDLRLASLPSSYDRLVDEHRGLPDDEHRRLIGERGHVRELCAELASFGLAETIEHDDFHDGQVFVRDGRYLLLDWGDACVAHHFFSLAVTLDGVLGWGLEDVQGSLDTTPFQQAYLRPFAERTGRNDLARAATIARRLGWVCRAVNCLTGAEPAITLPQLHMFLDGRP
jgi:hypothetical protein